MIDWSTVEAAIQNWIETGSGLPDTSVIWEQQAGPRPDTPYISILIDRVQRIGQDWVDTEDNPTPSPGQEILLQARGVREIGLQITAFGGSAVGGTSPRALLDGVQSRLPHERANLNAAGLGIARFDPVINVGAVRSTVIFEPRMILGCSGFLASEVSLPDTFIEFSEITDNINGNTFVVP